MKPIIKHTPVTYFFNITCLFAIWRRYYNILHTFKNHIHLNPWKVVRYCKLESKKWRYVLIRCVGRCLLIGGFSRDTHGAPGTYTGVIRPFRLGWSCKSDGPSWIWTAMVACRGAQKILCLRNTSCIIMLHQFTRLMTCILVYTYLMYIYIYIFIQDIQYIHFLCILETAYLKLSRLLTEQLVDCSVSQVWRLLYWNCMAMNVSQPHLQLFCQRVHKPTRNAVMVPYTLHMSKWNYQVPVIYIYMGWNNPIVTAKGPKNCLKPDLAAHVLGIGTNPPPCDLRRCFLRRVQHAGGHLG